MSVILALGRLKQEDHLLKASLTDRHSKNLSLKKIFFFSGNLVDLKVLKNGCITIIQIFFMQMIFA